MTRTYVQRAISLASAAVALMLCAPLHGHSIDKELLEILLGNGAITQPQHEALVAKLAHNEDQNHAPSSATAATGETIATVTPIETGTLVETEMAINDKIAQQVALQVDAATPINASHGSKGFRLETRDGNWQTNLQWRGQLRYTFPLIGDPRQLSNFNAPNQSNFEARRLRMKIGGHGYQPWLKYYFELDLQPTRDVDDSSESASTRVIDWRVDVDKWEWGGLRVGQWKVDYNRERVDSSGRQQFVERSIINRSFTIDRQVGVQLRGHSFKNTRADLRWYFGAFTGEGRGVSNTDNNLMYVGRLQWNFLGRDLGYKQTDVEFTELPTASFALGAATTRGTCTRWSSSGCGNLDGFVSPADAEPDQFKVEQAVQEFAFKWRGLSVQQELHHKEITDRVADIKSNLTGGYIQSGYFFHSLFPNVPKPLELAVRYAFLEEPNEQDIRFDNDRQELTLAANWFFSGHNNKLTLDYSQLRLDDSFIDRTESENRVRLQWDVSF